MVWRERWARVNPAMFAETSPGPVKYAASLLGICAADTRLPLCEVSDNTKERVKSALRGAGLLP